MAIQEDQFVLVQHLVNRPDKPLVSDPFPIQIIRDLAERFARDRAKGGEPLFFRKRPDETPEPTAKPIKRSDLHGSPRITAAEQAKAKAR